MRARNPSFLRIRLQNLSIKFTFECKLPSGATGMEKTKFREVITPQQSFFDFKLKELWNYRDLIMLFVKRDFVAQYKQTLLGPLWFVLQPILTAIMFYLIFGRIASIPTQGIHPFLFYFSGLTLWGYFSDVFTKCSNTFAGNAALFGKVYFPRMAVPMSIVISGLYKWWIQSMVLIAAIIGLYVLGVERTNVHWTLVLIPVYIFILAFLGLGLGILFSSLTTKYRDLSFLLTFGVQLLMYGTPIIYPLSFTSGLMRKVLEWNPLTGILENFRYAVFSVGSFDFGGLMYSFVFTLIALTVGILVFYRVEKSFMDTV
jgi:lipopolysaccharide transport system permease protein